MIFVFSEAVPKQWAVRHSDRAALLAAPLVTTLVRFPPTRFVSGALIGLARLITPGGRAEQPAPDVTESELLAFADVAALDEAIESDERVLIHSIIEFGDTIVREVMVPRPDVVAVEDSAETGAVLERAIEAGYSRIPVFNESLDDVIGIAFTKDLIRAAAQRQGTLPGEPRSAGRRTTFPRPSASPRSCARCKPVSSISPSSSTSTAAPPAS